MAQHQPLLQLLRGPRGKLWEVCIGLEVHAQVLSRSKLMSGSAAATLSSVRPNRHVSFLDAAVPGTLPVINRECVHQAIRTALALDATVHLRSLFERKHYFYCDLPLGYQLTQQRAPVASGGALRFDVALSNVVSEHGGAWASSETTFDASKFKSRKEKNEARARWKTKQLSKQQVRRNEGFYRKVELFTCYLHTVRLLCWTLCEWVVVTRFVVFMLVLYFGNVGCDFEKGTDLSYSAGAGFRFEFVRNVAYG